MGDIINFKNYMSKLDREDDDANVDNNKDSSSEVDNSKIIKMDNRPATEAEFLEARYEILKKVFSSPERAKEFRDKIVNVCKEFAIEHAEEIGVVDFLLWDVLCDEGLDRFMKQMIARRHERWNKLQELLATLKKKT